MDIQIRGLDKFADLIQRHPERSMKAQISAVNTTTRFAYAEASRAIRGQVNLTQPYIGSATAGNRLVVTKKASGTNPEAKITARKRATSLARYATSRSLDRRRGVSVRVKPRGAARRIKGAFLLKLKKGASLNEDAYNLGLALRLKPGTPVRNKYRMKSFGASDPNLYLLYAPSVDQVFRGVAGDIQPKVSSYLQREFLRQYERYMRG